MKLILDQVLDDGILHSTYLESAYSDYSLNAQLFLLPIHSTISSMVQPYSSL